MKKIKWLYFVIVIAMAVSCDRTKEKEPETKDSTIQGERQLTLDTPRTFISLAQLVLDTLIEAEGPTLLDETKSGNFKKIWKYDEQLYLESSKSKKFIVTKEINPCCPCSGTESACCVCLIDTDFAAVSDMGAAATLDGVDMKTTSTIPNVDIFSIPDGTTPATPHTLKIKGRSGPEVTYTITIVGNTIQFK
jgi:hypothetical protein